MFFWNSLAFFDDPEEIGNLISGSSAFSKSTLDIWKFTDHILLKPGLENFVHYFTSVWDKCNCMVVGVFFGIAFLWDWMKTDLFQSCGHCWVFQICWHIEGQSCFYCLCCSHHGQQKSMKCSAWMQSQKQQNDLSLFPRKTIQYHGNPSLCPNQ